jgi:hypothetical protein
MKSILDVQYSFYYDCVDNIDKSFNEATELKLLPISETKKTMIVQSLDSATTYFKSIVNSSTMMNVDIKPKELFNDYKRYIDTKADNKKFAMNSTSFLGKLKDCTEFIKFRTKRMNGENPTNYIYIDRAAMIDFFTKKHFWNEYDDIDDKLDPLEDNDDGKIKVEQSVQYVLKSEHDEVLKQLQKYQLLELQQMHNDTIVKLNRLTESFNKIPKIEKPNLSVTDYFDKLL